MEVKNCSVLVGMALNVLACLLCDCFLSLLYVNFFAVSSLFLLCTSLYWSEELKIGRGISSQSINQNTFVNCRKSRANRNRSIVNLICISQFTVSDIYLS